MREPSAPWTAFEPRGRLPQSGEQAAADALPSLPEECRREILRAVVRAAGQRELPSSAAAGTALQDDSADVRRARAVAVAVRTCRYLAARQGGVDGPSSPPPGAPAPSCPSCSVGGRPPRPGAMYGGDDEPTVVLERVRTVARAERPALSSAPVVGPGRDSRRVPWWSLALSAAALVGGTVAIQQEGREAPRSGTASVPGASTSEAPPGPTANPAVPAVRSTAGGGAGESGTAGPAKGLAGAGPTGPGSPKPSATGRTSAAPVATGPQASGSGAPTGPPSGGPASDGPTEPRAGRTSPGPTPTGTRRPASEPPPTPPTTLVPASPSVPVVVVPSSAPPSPVGTPPSTPEPPVGSPTATDPR